MSLDELSAPQMAIALERGNPLTIPFKRSVAGVPQPRGDFQVKIEVLGKFELAGVPDSSDPQVWNFRFTPEHAVQLGESPRTYKMVLIHPDNTEQTLWRAPIQATGWA